MRLIPKKSKLNATVWKSFGIFDFLLIFAFVMIAFVIVLSNIPGKWYILLALIPVCAMLFVPDGNGGRGYNEIVHVLKFVFSKKRFSASAKKKSGSVDALVPPMRITEDGVLDYGDYLGGVIELGSTAFGLKSEYQQNAMISAFATALSALSINTGMQIVKIERPVNFDVFAADVYARLRNTQAPAKQLVLRSRLQQIDALNNIERQYRPFYYLVLYAPDCSALDMLCDSMIGAAEACGLPYKRLTDEHDVAVFLKYTFTRDFDEHNFVSLPPKAFTDAIRPQNIAFRLADTEIDGKYSFTYAVSDYPLTVGNAWGAALFSVPDTKVVLNIHPIERERAIKRIDRTIAEIGARDSVNKASEMIAQDTHISTMGALLQSLQNENEALFDCTITITGYNNSQESNAAFRKRVRQAIVTQGFRLSPLRARQLDGYVASSLTLRDPLKNYFRGINSESLAAVFPFVFTSVIERGGIVLGESGGYPFIFNPWKWEQAGGEFVNSNMFVAGTSGSGKSYFAKSLMAQLHADNVVLYVLDPENEYRYLCRNVGGTFIDVGSAITGRINPFHVYSTLTDDGEPAPPETTFSAHLMYLENFFTVTLPGIASDTIEEINNLVVKCYAKKGITQNTDCTYFKPDAFPTFDDLYALVKAELGTEKGNMRYENLQRAESYLAKFAAGGRFSALWNGPSTLSASDSFTVFNFQSLFEAKNKVTSNGQMLTVLRFLEQQIINLREKNANLPRDERLRPVVVIDEGYMYIDPKNPVALEFIYQWYKRIRKYSGSMIFLTQNLADIVGNAEIISKTSAIINNTQYSFIMTLQGKDVEVLQDIFAARNLTVAEIDEITRTDKPKGTAFFMGSATQRAMLHVITAREVEALFSREINVRERLEPPLPSTEQSDVPAPPTDEPPADKKTQKENDNE